MQSIQDVNELDICLNLKKISRFLTNFYDLSLKNSGIRSTQFNLLIAFYKSPEKSITDIAKDMGMDRTTLSRNLNPLLKKQLIILAALLDKRCKSYVLTEKGKNIIEDALPYFERAKKFIILLLGDKKHDKLLSDIKELLKITTDVSQ